MSVDWRQNLLQLQEQMSNVADSAEDAVAIVELDQSKVGRLSRMDALQGQAMAQASKDRRDRKLRLIDAALARLDGDDFGNCHRCEESIDENRLVFDPTVLLCIECARKAEQE